MPSESRSQASFVDLIKMLKERLLQYCHPRLRRNNPRQCLKLYNGMKRFFFEIKGVR